MEPTSLQRTPELYVRQVRELAELFGFETRNKYAITTSDREEVAYAAEQQKGILGFLLRQFMGHWRPFQIQFFNTARQPTYKAVHPFRFFFQRLEIFDPSDRMIGAIQQRFGIITKKFDVLGRDGEVLLEMRSTLFKLWTFPFFRDGREEAVIEKKWGGGITELFTDKDNFRVRFIGNLTADERILITAAAIFVDLQYFEAKAN